jgi:hypothetical protein
MPFSFGTVLMWFMRPRRAPVQELDDAGADEVRLIDANDVTGVG